MMKKLFKILLMIVIGIFAVLGILFVVLMFIPDEDGYTLDEDGYTLDEDGYTLDEDGYTLDEDGYTLDEDGYTLDEDGYTLDEDEYTSYEGKKIKDNEVADELRDLGMARASNIETVGDGNDTITFLVFMNGSNLESDDGQATRDIQEMINSRPNDNINILVQTMGTRKWRKYGISSDRAQRYRVTNRGLKLVNDDVGKVSVSEKDTLSDFIKWGAANYPADRYFLLFWDHGAGPVYGFGYDDRYESNETLTLDEIQGALKDAGVYFDFIGMDCCIMAALETCCALYDYCDYTVLSEDFESGLGWSYSGFLTELRRNPSIATTELAKIAIDDMVKENVLNKSWGDSAILALIDESTMATLYTAWKDFAYANEATLLDSNYSRGLKRSGRAHPILLKSHPRNVIADGANVLYDGWDFDTSDYVDNSGQGQYNMADYYVTDIMSVAQNVDSKESKALASALDAAIVYSNSTKNDKGLTGLSVTLPYGDRNFYQQLKTVFVNCGFDKEYVNFLSRFSGASGTEEFYDYSDWEGDWNGWDEYEDDYDWNEWDCYKDGSCQEDVDSQGWYDDFDYNDSYNYWLDENYRDDYGVNVDEYYSDDYGPDDYYYEDDYIDGSNEKYAEFIY